jgi:hypothetical protein
MGQDGNAIGTFPPCPVGKPKQKCQIPGHQGNLAGRCNGRKIAGMRRSSDGRITIAGQSAQAVDTEMEAICGHFPR